MIRKDDLSLVLLLGFILLYTVVGDPSSDIWSGCYFLTLHTVILLAYSNHKNKVIRNGNTALQVSILIFVLAKFFLGFKCDRIYSIIPFLITYSILLLLERKNIKKIGRDSNK